MSLTVVPRLTLGQLLSPDTVELCLQGKERSAVFAELIARIPDLTGKPEAKRGLLRALEQREKLGSTALGHGIALPHTRNVIAGMNGQGVIVFGRHAQGIAYEAPDDTPVRLLFLLIAPSISLHLQLLSRLSRILRGASLRQSLLEAEAPQEVIELIAAAEEKSRDL